MISSGNLKIKELRAFNNRQPAIRCHIHKIQLSGRDQQIRIECPDRQCFPAGLSGKNTICNSYNSSSPEATPVIEEAIVITNSEKEGDTAKIITGTFNAKIYSDNKKADAKSTEAYY